MHDPVKTALRFGSQALTYGELDIATGALAARLGNAVPPGARVAVWALPTAGTAVAVLAGLRAGTPVVPLNPRSGSAELGHIVSDSAPSLVLAPPGVALPPALAALARIDVDPWARAESAAWTAPEPEPSAPAFVVYTSGTTGPPKGAVLPHRAVRATLDALAEVWDWTASDVLVHALPLFHVHGLILGVLGPLRRGGTLVHLGRFDVEGVARELGAGGGTMLFGVPTMYHRIAEALPGDPALARALAGARLLVSGSAALPVHDHERITAATGRRVVERYGMTETLMNTSVLPGAATAPGTVGPPLPGVELRLVDEAGLPLPAPGGGLGDDLGDNSGDGLGDDSGDGGLGDGESVGEVQVRGANVFSGYLGRPEATAAAFDGDWFRTGDMAVRAADGSVRLVGRRATDLIKSGGYKIGAGEIENALLEHPAVREAAVTAEPDPDLGERIVAWVVPEEGTQAPPVLEELGDHVAARLAPHKRPRVLHLLPALPRNDMGKILKRALSPHPEATGPAPGGAPEH